MPSARTRLTLLPSGSSPAYHRDHPGQIASTAQTPASGPARSHPSTRSRGIDGPARPRRTWPAPPPAMAHTAPSAARASPESEPHSIWEPPCHPEPRQPPSPPPVQELQDGLAPRRPDLVGRTRPAARRRASRSPDPGRSTGGSADHRRAGGGRRSPRRARRCPRCPPRRPGDHRPGAIDSHCPERADGTSPAGPTTQHRPVRCHRHEHRRGIARAAYRRTGACVRHDRPSNRRTSSPERTSTPPVGSARSSSANGGAPGPSIAVHRSPSRRITVCSSSAVGEQDLTDGPHGRPRCRR